MFEGIVMTSVRKSPAGNRRYRRLDGEPTIGELLDDPVIEAIMARDGVARADLVHLIDEVRGKLERRGARELAATGPSARDSAPAAL
jgi:hypothetical protein